MNEHDDHTKIWDAILTLSLVLLALALFHSWFGDPL